MSLGLLQVFLGHFKKTESVLIRRVGKPIVQQHFVVLPIRVVDENLITLFNVTIGGNIKLLVDWIEIEESVVELSMVEHFEYWRNAGRIMVSSDLEPVWCNNFALLSALIVEN